MFVRIAAAIDRMLLFNLVKLRENCSPWSASGLSLVVWELHEQAQFSVDAMCGFRLRHRTGDDLIRLFALGLTLTGCMLSRPLWSRWQCNLSWLPLSIGNLTLAENLVSCAPHPAPRLLAAEH